ncbi:GNAT family N-acetyltransferase [Clostridium sp. CM028]|uniref:GNAT family N-acetyltransferase n=1 Tax=unclassified Clostridium TaxID=2614128 RepID=UPI001C0C97FE|nr:MULTISPECIES: GNAT family N-acetyltransferase [unclassified Clostridium]MBU3091827.1 GNAT family N-acetyltransferase [Clostridium sp. CF011]MBW9145387.1 GNAT family N-acetyltransferase [Clostridium sp. CM027]MBW9148793.1 GNAT family N-acetyltransferase [Clostridium sp. CM028]UVE42525.1 GNAT family N-acetyltransferase [Clostridium sp. CM027]WAG68273.1 GNAT family N-acetyltransferase [Clostridium sp. CF011]
MDNYHHTISIKLELNEEEYEAIKSLEAACYEKQKINLKLELGLKMRQRKKNVKNKIVGEFLYYENEILVGYLGLCNFGGATVEISGMVHPNFRRKGIFKKLYLIAKEEWQRICPQEVLMICDHTSVSGLAFINSIGAEYGCSEYKMCLNKKVLEATPSNVIKLRLASTSEDAVEIDRQSSIYFGTPKKDAHDKEDKMDMEKPSINVDDNFISYMAELNGEIIGKIHICINDNEGFIYGVGVIPDFRRKGYGREILNSALNILNNKNVDNIFIEVSRSNKNALGLYESCGFEEISVMDYYVVY